MASKRRSRIGNFCVMTRMISSAEFTASILTHLQESHIQSSIQKLEGRNNHCRLREMYCFIPEMKMSPNRPSPRQKMICGLKSIFNRSSTKGVPRKGYTYRPPYTFADSFFMILEVLLDRLHRNTRTLRFFLHFQVLEIHTSLQDFPQNPLWSASLLLSDEGSTCLGQISYYKYISFLLLITRRQP